MMKQNLPVDAETFHSTILQWFEINGRKNLPWQLNTNSYTVWISEVMLQQTQVETVIPYFLRFMQHFPDVESLAQAELDSVLHFWSGLGYYARGRNIHQAAKKIVSEFQGKLPKDLEQLQTLPGIGRSTAGAILSLGHGQTASILDGNVKRVLARCFNIEGYVGESKILKKFWSIAVQLTPNESCQQYNQAMMDMGSLVCRRTKPLCDACPVSDYCQALKLNTIGLLPTKKAKKNKLVKAHSFYWIEDEQHRVFLVKRPPVGIWGGMWCLPTKDDLPFTKNRIIENQIKSTFKQEFTHFSMQGTIYNLSEPMPAFIMDAGEYTWYDPVNPQPLGLPTPIANNIKVNRHE